jgi:RsiW-degrading membrane proteinase PrsW (M82 family)
MVPLDDCGGARRAFNFPSQFTGPPLRDRARGVRDIGMDHKYIFALLVACITLAAGASMVMWPYETIAELVFCGSVFCVIAILGWWVIVGFVRTKRPQNLTTALLVTGAVLGAYILISN